MKHDSLVTGFLYSLLQARIFPSILGQGDSGSNRLEPNRWKAWSLHSLAMHRVVIASVTRPFMFMLSSVLNEPRYPSHSTTVSHSRQRCPRMNASQNGAVRMGACHPMRDTRLIVGERNRPSRPEHE